MLQYTWRAVYILGKERVRGKGKRVKERSEMNTNLAVFVRFANVEERASAALVLFTAHDGVHRT